MGMSPLKRQKDVSPYSKKILREEKEKGATPAFSRNSPAIKGSKRNALIICGLPSPKKAVSIENPNSATRGEKINKNEAT